MDEERETVGDSIRVNLRFGRGTDPALWRALEALEPYARAKFVRKLMLEAWRARQRGEPVIASAHPGVQGGVRSAESGHQLAQDILSLLGGAVRL
jgi:hypothetical protein